MFCKIIFRVGLCVLLLTIFSCSAPEAITPKATAEAESEELAGDTSEVIISLGDSKLTMQQVKWTQPKADDQRIAEIAKWWLETELLYAEAERRGITKGPKAKFIAELARKMAFSRELSAQVRKSVEISDEKILAHYEENKDTNPRLKEPGSLNFSHVRTKTLQEAQAVLERIKAGEDINALARELSIYGDAKRGGVARKYVYQTLKRRFGTEFFEALVNAEKNAIIGPVKIKDDAYEVARQEGKTEPHILPFEKVKEQIKSQLLRTESNNAFTKLLNSLKEQAADKIAKSPRIIQAEKAAAEKSKPGRKRGKGERK